MLYSRIHGHVESVCSGAIDDHQVKRSMDRQDVCFVTPVEALWTRAVHLGRIFSLFFSHGLFLRKGRGHLESLGSLSVLRDRMSEVVDD